MPQEHHWQLQEAKNKLSEVVNRARDAGPQIITRHGKAEAVIVSFREYTKLRTRSKNKRVTLAEFFAQSPLRGSGLVIERNPSGSRAVDLQ